MRLNLYKLLKRMKLKLNDKSKIVNALDESFDFLGHTFRLDDDLLGRKNKILERRAKQNLKRE